MKYKDLLDKYKPVLLPLLLLASILGLALITPGFLGLVEVLGKRIPQNNIRLDYVKGAFWAIFLGSTILFWPIRLSDKKALMWIWLVKCLVMLGFMLFYEYYYQVDSYGYFSGARHSMSEWKAMCLASTSLPVVFITWLHQHLFLDSFHAIKVSFGMIGLVGIYIFYRSSVIFLKQDKIILLYVFGLFPTMLFWSSILGKEPLAFLGMAIYCCGVVAWLTMNYRYSAILALSGIFIAVIMRPWMVFILGAPLIITIPLVLRNSVKTKIAIFLIIAFMLLFFGRQVAVNFTAKTNRGLPFFSWLLDVGNQKYNGFAQGGSATGIKSVEMPASTLQADALLTYSLDEINSNAALAPKYRYKYRYRTPLDMLIYLPWGMFTVLFRPFPGEVNNFFGLLSGLEGVFLLMLFSLAVIRARWIKFAHPVILWAILLTTLWAAVYAFVGFNLGTNSRYKLQILPIFLSLLFYFYSKKTLIQPKTGEK